MADNFSLTKYFREQYIKEFKSNAQKETDPMRSSTFTSYDKDGEQSYLKEFTDYGQSGRYPKKEKPGDMFQQKEVENMFPNGMASRSDKAFQSRVKQHADWTEQGGYNNTFVHMQYRETKGLEDDYFIYQTQHYNGNYDDFRNPKFTLLSITKNKDTENEEDLGEYIVDTNAYVKDLETLRNRGVLGDRVMEAMDMNDPVLVKMRAAKLANKKADKEIDNIKRMNPKADRKSLDMIKQIGMLQTKPKKMRISPKAAELVDGFELEDLQRNLEQIYRDMEQEAEPEGGPIADQYADEIDAHEQAIRFIKNQGKERAQMTYDQAIAMDEGSCGYTPDGKPRNKPAGPNLMEIKEKVFNSFKK